MGPMFDLVQVKLCSKQLEMHSTGSVDTQTLYTHEVESQRSPVRKYNKFHEIVMASNVPLRTCVPKFSPYFP